MLCYGILRGVHHLLEAVLLFSLRAASHRASMEMCVIVKALVMDS